MRPARGIRATLLTLTQETPRIPPDVIVWRRFYGRRRTSPARRPRAGARAAGQLDRQLQRQQIVRVELEPGQLLDPGEPLAQRVRVDVQRPRALDHRSAFCQVALERVEQRGSALGVVGDQQVDGAPHPVVGRVLRGDVDEVAVGAELGVRDRAAIAEQRPADRRRVPRLAIGPGPVARGARAAR